MATYYVSASGNDANDGLSPANAFRTSERLAMSLGRGDTGLYESGGEYDPLILSSIAASGEQKVVIDHYGSGPRPACKATISPTWSSEGGNIWSYQNNEFENVPFLVINGENRHRGWTDFFSINSFSTNTSVTSSGISNLSDVVGGELVTKKVRWTIDRHVITSQTSDTLDVSGSGRWYVAGRQFFVQNHPNCLSEDGDWCYVDAEKKVYIYHETDPNLEDIEIPFQRNALRVTGVSRFEVQNMKFVGGYEDTFYISSSSNSLIDLCKFRFSGREGIRTFTTTNLMIRRSWVRDTCNHGINFRDASPSCTVENCKLQDIAVILGAGVSGDNQYNGINIGTQETNTTVSRCYMKNVGNCGVYFRNTDTSVTRCYAEKCSYLVGDSAGFYYFGNFNNIYENLVCSYNIATDCNANNILIPNSTSNDSCGFYMDDNSINLTMEKNYAFENGIGLFLHNASIMSITNNIFYKNSRAQVRFRDDKAQDHSGGTRRIRDIFMQNNKFVSLAGQYAYEISVIGNEGDFADDDPWKFGDINNNEFDYHGDAFYIELTWNAGYPKLTDLAGLEVETRELDQNDNPIQGSGLDPDSVEFEFDPNELLVLENNSEEEETYNLSGLWEDWDGNIHEDEITLGAYESVVLFQLDATEPPPPSPPPPPPLESAFFVKGRRFVEA